MKLPDHVIYQVQEVKRENYFKVPVLAAMVVGTIVEINCVGAEFALRLTRNVLEGGNR